MTRERYSKDFIADVRSRTSLIALIGQRVALRRRGSEMLGLCPFHDERTPSFTVVEAKGFFHCFGCGAHGSAIDFLMALDHMSFLEALEQLAEDAGLLAHGTAVRREPAPPIERPSIEAMALDREQEVIACREIWKRGIPIPDGSPVDLYLVGRGIVRRPLPPTLRFIPDLRYRDPDDPPNQSRFFPAMIAAIQNVEGEVVGLHRTYVRADGGGKAPVPHPKKMKGDCWGGAVRFGKAGERLGVGEGLETCLTVWQLDEPNLPIWAALSLGNMAGNGVGHGPPYPGQKLSQGARPRLAPSADPDLAKPGIRYPAIVKRLLLLCDADNKDRLAANQLLLRASRREQINGRSVRLAFPPEGHDFNSLLMTA